MHVLRQWRWVLAGLLALLATGCLDMPVKLPATVTGTSVQPTQQEVTDGLREALSQGVTRAISQLGREGAFTADRRVRIPLPDELARVADTLERLGQERHVREFEQSLNRAAEESVPYATAIFARALGAMTLEDALGIVRGPSDAATTYFRQHAEGELYDAFLPVVARQTDSVGVTQAYKDMIDRTGMLKSVLSPELQDLDAYVTRRALDGLFLYIAEEEGRIRAQPVARTTELLRKVFGYYAAR
ncbi:MAG: DUF4197 domain-containing protein [Gammaproteobacteria bacterium]|nr:DUF4197 domain-containing protein [Gammaproteobacteria bacterium]MDX5375528.1 DUF4197 domain-containing protein [Gammaproteobacteria bacterium]